MTENGDVVSSRSSSSDQVIDEEQRREILDRAVAVYVSHGYKVESNTGRQAIVAKQRPINVLLNLLLTLVTGGLWLIVVALRLINRPVDRVVLTIDRWGVIVPSFSS